MRKGFVIIAITELEGIRNHGSVNMRLFMLLECAKIATLTDITKYILFYEDEEGSSTKGQ